MTVGELRSVLAGWPDETPVLLREIFCDFAGDLDVELRSVVRGDHGPIIEMLIGEPDDDDDGDDDDDYDDLRCCRCDELIENCECEHGPVIMAQLDDDEDDDEDDLYDRRHDAPTAILDRNDKDG